MLQSMKDRRQSDRVTTPTRAGLRPCRWPRPINEERLWLAALSRNRPQAALPRHTPRRRGNKQTD